MRGLHAAVGVQRRQPALPEPVLDRVGRRLPEPVPAVVEAGGLARRPALDAAGHALVGDLRLQHREEELPVLQRRLLLRLPPHRAALPDRQQRQRLRGARPAHPRPERRGAQRGRQARLPRGGRLPRYRERQLRVRGLRDELLGLQAPPVPERRVPERGALLHGGGALVLQLPAG